MYPPSGFTPIVRTIEQMMLEKKALFDEGKKVLVILATDGQPTTDDGTVNIKDFTRLLNNKPKNMYMSIVACTDDDSAVSYLSGLDGAIENLDVVDDYKTECRAVTRWKRNAKFTLGDYVVKIMLASIDKELDKSDGRGIFTACFTGIIDAIASLCSPKQQKPEPDTKNADETAKANANGSATDGNANENATEAPSSAAATTTNALTAEKVISPKNDPEASSSSNKLYPNAVPPADSNTNANAST